MPDDWRLFGTAGASLALEAGTWTLRFLRAPASKQVGSVWAGGCVGHDAGVLLSGIRVPPCVPSSDGQLSSWEAGTHTAKIISAPPLARSCGVITTD